MKLTLHLLICLLLAGCSAEKVSVDPLPSAAVFGKWKMKSYADGKEIPFDVTIEMKSEKDSSGRYIIRGKSPLNFYFSTFEIDFTTKSIQLFDIQITKVEGESNIVSFENTYYETLSKIVNYEVSSDGKTMKLLLPKSENQHIMYDHLP